jgi:hypothetical protein
MNKKPLTVASLNVKGLGKNSSKQKEIHSWISSLVPTLQILFLHEHHLGEINCSNSTKGSNSRMALLFGTMAYQWGTHSE